MFFKAMTLMLWVIAIGMGASLFWASGEVQDAENTHLKLSREIGRAQARLHVLNAEWNYLNNPEYLEKMAARYLDIEKEVEEGRIVVAGDALPRYVEVSVPPEKPDLIMVSTIDTSQKEAMSSKNISSVQPVAHSAPVREAEFGAVLANWSGGQ